MQEQQPINHHETPPGGSPCLNSPKGEKKRKTIKLYGSSQITQRVIEELDNFLGFVPPRRLSRTLRKLLLLYISYEKDDLLFKEETLIDIYFLFNFLDVAEEEVVEDVS